MTEISFRSLGPFGVQIDADLSAPLSSDLHDALAKLRRDHHLILARDQAMTMDQQLDLMSCFGPVLRSRDDGIGYISNTRPDGILGDTELEFHSDQDYSPMGAYYMISLLGIEISGPGAATTFCSAVQAYDQLPEQLRSRLLGMEALDVQLVKLSERNRVQDVPKNALRCVHPLVRHLPLTGRPALYASRSGTDKIMGLEEPQSAALLEELFFHLYSPANLYRHEWRTGDLIIWDNRALQHCREPIPAGALRTLQRVSCAEPEAGIFDAYPEMMKRSVYAAKTA